MFNKTSGTKFICEIKDRWTYKSTAYNDHVIESNKLKGLVKRIKNGEADKISLFTIYDDGVVKVTSDIIKQLIGYKQTTAPTTTALEDHTKTEKNFVLIKPELQFYFCVYEDTDNPNKSNFYVHFDSEPINIKKLNDDLLKIDQASSLF